MNDKSTAMVFTGPGDPLQKREYPLPSLSSGEVLVRVTCCTLCGSDLHSYQGRRPVPCPTILGHEILGSVAALPGDVSGGEPMEDYLGRPLHLGDRVTWSVTASCGNCFFCSHDLPQKCERLFKYGHELLDRSHPLSGGLAEHCHLAPGTAVLKVPDELPDEVACPVNCATATVAAAWRAIGDCRDQVVLVQGAGTLGLTACAMARWLGARETVVCDVDPKRLSLAGDFGATRTVRVTAEADDLGRVIREVSHDRGADAALELSGAPEAFQRGIQLLRIGGRYALVGAVFPSRPAEIPAETLVRKLLAIRGIHNYGPQDLHTALNFLTESHNDYPFAELVAARFSLSDAVAAFEHAEESGAFRVAVVP